MPILAPDTSALLLIDFQSRLMPAIANAAATVANARRLLHAASMLAIPVLATEQNPDKLGGTVSELASAHPLLAKLTFDACRAADFDSSLPERHAIVVAGWEAHVCVLQTALGLLDRGRRVYLVRDAVGSRATANRDAAIRRMERHGAEVITTEMAVFEWLGTAAHPRFRDAMALIK